MEAIFKSAGDVCVPASTPQTGTAGAPAARPARDGRMLLRELIGQYLSAYEGKDPTRLQRLTFWAQRLGHVAIGDLVDDDVADALEELGSRRGAYFCGKDMNGSPILRAKARPMAAATVNRYAAALSSVCTWAQKRRLTERSWQNPLKFVEKRKESPGRLRFLDRDEIARLLKACEAQKWPKLHLIVHMAITTGCRRGELEGLRWGDLDLDGGLASLVDTKNGAPRQVPLVDAVVAELRPFVGKSGAMVFGSTRRPDTAFNFTPGWHAALKAAGIRGATFHTLRHTSASHLVMAGASLHEVGQVLGHKTVSMSARYAHLSVQHKTDLVRRTLGNIGTP